MEKDTKLSLNYHQILTLSVPLLNSAKITLNDGDQKHFKCKKAKNIFTFVFYTGKKTHEYQPIKCFKDVKNKTFLLFYFPWLNGLHQPNTVSYYLSIWASSWETCLREFPTRSDSNRPAQLQKLAWGLKFWLLFSGTLLLANISNLHETRDITLSRQWTTIRIWHKTCFLMVWPAHINKC